MTAPLKHPAFCDDENGAALVEFALVLPMALLLVGICIEGGRTFLSYQTAIAGVRDAARHLARIIEPGEAGNCPSVAGRESLLRRIVETGQGGETLFPAAVSVESVTATMACGSVPIATVTATLLIDYPFRGLFALAGQPPAALRTVVSDQTRIIGP